MKTSEEILRKAIEDCLHFARKNDIQGVIDTCLLAKERAPEPKPLAPVMDRETFNMYDRLFRSGR